MTAHLNPASAEDRDDGPAISLWTLQRDLSRLADELAEAARQADTRPAPDEERAPSADIAPRDYFSALLAQRRARDRYFGSSLFSEPAWDIMLELMIARIDRRELRVSELGAGGYAPGAVTRQYVDALAEANLIERYEDAEDSADCFLALSSEAARRMAELYRARARG